MFEQFALKLRLKYLFIIHLPILKRLLFKDFLFLKYSWYVDNLFLLSLSPTGQIRNSITVISNFTTF